MHSILITQVSGTPVLKVKNLDQVIEYKNKQKIERDFELQTNSKSYLIMQLNGLFETIVLPDSDVQLEGKQDKSSFNAEELNLKAGKIFLRTIDVQNKKNDSDSINFKSDFFQFDLKSSAQIALLISIDKKTRQLSVCNQGDSFDLKLFDHEESHLLEKTQGIRFNGVLDEKGSVKYDYLLKQRKIPQGKWLKVETCDLKEIEVIQKKINDQIVSEIAESKKKELNKKADKIKNDVRYLCHEPYGQLSDCAYQIKNDKCQRSRCNAEGKWAELTEVSKSKNKCEKIVHISTCDY